MDAFIYFLSKERKSLVSLVSSFHSNEDMVLGESRYYVFNVKCLPQDHVL